MLRAITSNQFEKDIKLSKKRGKDLTKRVSGITLLSILIFIPLKKDDGHELIDIPK